MKRVLQGLAEEEKERKQRRIERERRSLEGAMEEREERERESRREELIDFLCSCWEGKGKVGGVGKGGSLFEGRKKIINEREKRF